MHCVEADLNGKSEEAVESYIKEMDSNFLKELKNELDILVKKQSSWHIAFKVANRRFRNDEKKQKARAWLEMIRKKINVSNPSIIDFNFKEN